jgi:MraZ protein
MFFGQYHTSLNDQGQLALPAHFRQALTGGAIVTQGFDRNLLVLPVEAFQGIFQRIKTVNLANPSARLLLRMFLGSASEAALDEGGNISIPENLREFANLDESEVVMVGQGDYCEVWAPALWHKQEIRLQDAEANAERFVLLDVVVS